MVSFHHLLVLAYFKETKTLYSIAELTEFLGTNIDHVEELLTELMNAGYLAYNEGLLQVTEKGFTKLIAEDRGEMVIRSDSKALTSISPDAALSFDEVYVPSDFDAKLGYRKKSKGRQVRRKRV